MSPIPYEGTRVSPERSQAEIQKLLYRHGAKGVQWTMLGDRTRLAFVLEEDGRPFTIRIDPPLLVRKRHEQGSRGKILTMTDPAASMRLLLWWLKSELEAIEFGLLSAKEAFLAHVTGRLPNGEEVTVGELIIPKLAAGLGPADLAKALPAPAKSADRTWTVEDVS